MRMCTSCGYEQSWTSPVSLQVQTGGFQHQIALLLRVHARGDHRRNQSGWHSVRLYEGTRVEMRRPEHCARLELRAFLVHLRQSRPRTGKSTSTILLQHFAEKKVQQKWKHELWRNHATLQMKVHIHIFSDVNWAQYRSNWPVSLGAVSAVQIWHTCSWKEFQPAHFRVGTVWNYTQIDNYLNTILAVSSFNSTWWWVSFGIRCDVLHKHPVQSALPTLDHFSLKYLWCPFWNSIEGSGVISCVVYWLEEGCKSIHKFTSSPVLQKDIFCAFHEGMRTQHAAPNKRYLVEISVYLSLSYSAVSCIILWELRIATEHDKPRHFSWLTSVIWYTFFSFFFFQFRSWWSFLQSLAPNCSKFLISSDRKLRTKFFSSTFHWHKTVLGFTVFRKKCFCHHKLQWSLLETALMNSTRILEINGNLVF